MPRQGQIRGGGFWRAPKIDRALLDEYAEIISQPHKPDFREQEQVLAACRTLHQAVAAYLDMPPSKSTCAVLQCVSSQKTVEVQPMDEDKVEALSGVVPWPYECDAMQVLFRSIPKGHPLQKVAYHLQWYGVELSKDLEPRTCSWTG